MSINARLQHFIFAIYLCFQLVYASGPEGDGIDPSRAVKRAKEWRDIETDDILTEVYRKKEDVVLSFYGLNCVYCMNVEAAHDVAAKEAKKRLKAAGKEGAIRFLRIDIFRMGEKEFFKKFPEFEPGVIPKVYYVRKGGRDKKDPSSKVTEVKHADMGWSRERWLDFYNFIRDNSGDLKVDLMSEKDRKAHYRQLESENEDEPEMPNDGEEEDGEEPVGEAKEEL